MQAGSRLLCARVNMKLYFIRHATASDHAPSDAERPLTKEGKEEARIVGWVLEELGVRPAEILTSPLKRAWQTAHLLAESMKFPHPVKTLEALTNDHHTPALLRALKPFPADAELCLVGHAPSLPEHLAELLGSKHHGSVPLGKGSVACVELDALHPGSGQLLWLLRQKQLRMMVR